MCADLWSRVLLFIFFIFFALFGGALCQLGLEPIRASIQRGPAESRPTTPNALTEANCCMRSPRFLGSSALCTEEEWGRIWIIHWILGHRWKIHFSLYYFFFLSFFYLRNNCLTFLIPLLFSLSWDLQIFKSPVLLKKCKGAAHHNNSSVNTQKRAYLTLCLLPPSERYIFSFLLKKRNKKKEKEMLCWNLPHVWKGDKSRASVRWSHRASTTKTWLGVF